MHMLGQLPYTLQTYLLRIKLDVCPILTSLSAVPVHDIADTHSEI